MCRLSSYLSTSSFQILGENLDFLFASFTQISNSVSDSSPAKPQSGTRNSSEPKKTTLTQKTLLDCGFNPRVALDEDNLPPEFTPQVLLDDDHNQFIDAVTLPANSSSELHGVKEVIPRQAASNTAPIDNVLPSTSSDKTVSPEISSDTQKTPPIKANPLLETASKGSPFTRFLLESGTQELKSRGVEPRRGRLLYPHQTSLNGLRSYKKRRGSLGLNVFWLKQPRRLQKK